MIVNGVRFDDSSAEVVDDDGERHGQDDLKLGAQVETTATDIVIDPPARVTPARIATYEDHRMAMSFAVAGLAVDGVVIEDPECVSKTFPGFFDELRKLSA